MHTFLVTTLSMSVLALVLFGLRFRSYFDLRHGEASAMDAIGDLVFALVSGCVGALAAWLLVKLG